MPLPVTISCPVVPAVLDSSPITVQCCCEGWAGTLWLCSSHVCVTNTPRQEQHPIPPWLFQNLHGMRQHNKLLPFSQVCGDAHKGADKEVQDKNGRNQSAGSSRELRLPTALVASAEHGECRNKTPASWGESAALGERVLLLSIHSVSQKSAGEKQLPKAMAGS